MIKNYLKIAWRNLWKGRVFNLMNVAGLAIAVACCTLIFLTVYYEFSYDNFHDKLDRIYQVYSVANRPKAIEKNSAMPIPMASALKAEYPAVKYVTRSGNMGGVVTYGNQKVDGDIHFIDPDFLKMFTFPLVQGNGNAALTGLNSALITEKAAIKIFGSKPALNQTVVININNEEKPFQITGVVKDYPANSSITFDILVRFEHFPLYQAEKNNWDSRSHIVFAEFNEGYDPQNFNSQIKPFVKKYYDEDLRNLKRDGAKPDANGNIFSLALTPFANNHFNNDIGAVEGNAISKTYPVSLVVIGCFILLIACINFINLSVARGFTRAREVGVRKTLGAAKWQLLAQFWVETIMVCFASTVIGLLLCTLLINQFKAIFKSKISLGMLLEPAHLAGIVMIFLLVTAVAGFYPALMMVRYKTVAVLKGRISSGKPGKLRNTLLVIQFTLSTLLIICTIITWQQINFLSNKPLGYNKTEVLSIPVEQGNKGIDALHLMRNELRNNNNVVSVSGAYMNMGRGNDGSSRRSVLGFVYNDREVRTHLQRVDYDYIKTLDIKLQDGREFNPDFGSDSTGLIINESMARELGGKNLIGSTLPILDGQPKAHIIGIAKNFNFESLHDDIAPLTLTMLKDFEINYIFVKVKPGNLVGGFDQIKNSWHRLYPNAEFKASWLNENTERQYLSERRLSGIFISGAVLAIIISCIGLLAISIMMVVQRNKEIGIRKVLGANILGIVLMLSQDFMKLVLAAAILSFPVAWWVMNHWLQGFAYRVDIHWWVFALSTALALILAFVTVSFQSIKAAIANPVKSLRSE
jgi:putative ABC transport system permease protein